MVITKKDNEYTDDGGIVYHSIIDTNGDFNFASTLINGNDIYHNPTNIRSKIEYIIENYKDRVNKFILMIEYGEARLSKKSSIIHTFPGIMEITSIFKEKKMFNRLVFRSNGINPKIKTLIKFQPISFFLGRDIDSMFDISERKFDYNFLSLYRTYKPIRERFHNFLRDNDILKKTLFSYNSEGLENSKYTNDYSISLENKSVDAKMLMKPGEYFKNTFCSLVYEAYWNENIVFFTEKINKCFLAGQPFIVISTPKYLDYLKKLGFKTFSNWWDESYDLQINDSKRKKMIEKIILEISKWDIKKCESVYKEMIPIIKHNQNILKHISENRVSDTYFLIDSLDNSKKKKLI
jgi:hypothetical protein